MREEPPYQPWREGDFWSSPTTRVLTGEEALLYRAMLNLAWQMKDGGLPKDPQTVLKLLRLVSKRNPNGSQRWTKRASNVLQKCFMFRDGRWFHPRVERELNEYKEMIKARSEAGRSGAESRWQTHGSRMTQARQGKATQSLGKGKAYSDTQDAGGGANAHPPTGGGLPEEAPLGGVAAGPPACQDAAVEDGLRRLKAKRKTLTALDPAELSSPKRLQSRWRQAVNLGLLRDDTELERVRFFAAARLAATREGINNRVAFFVDFLRQFTDDGIRDSDREWAESATKEATE